MKRHLTNDQCLPFIRKREEFENRRASLTGHTHAPGFRYTWGNLPRAYRDSVLEASFIVYSYDTPIAWYGPKLNLTAESVERFLAGPGLEELERYLSDETATAPIRHPFDSDLTWHMPAVRYSITTTEHQGVVQSALAYELTWRENPENKNIPAPHYARTEYATTDYRKFSTVPCGTTRRGW